MWQHYAALRVPFSVGGVELVPGVVFRVSGSDQPAQFIRITRIEAGIIWWQELSRIGRVIPQISAPVKFPVRFPGAILKFQAVMANDKWEAFADFLDFVSRWQLDRQQTWEMYLWFQDMAIEREMAELRQRKEAGG